MTSPSGRKAFRKGRFSHCTVRTAHRNDRRMGEGDFGVQLYTMDAEWNPAKARGNLRKHGVRFADAVTALEDVRAISVRRRSLGRRAMDKHWNGFLQPHPGSGVYMAR